MCGHFCLKRPSQYEWDHMNGITCMASCIGSCTDHASHHASHHTSQQTTSIASNTDRRIKHQVPSITSSTKHQASHQATSVSRNERQSQQASSVTKKTNQASGIKFQASNIKNPLFFTGVHINQDLIWCVKMGVYMGFWVHGGS